MVEEGDGYALYMLDRRHRHQTGTPAPQNIKGYSADEIIGSISRDYTPRTTVRPGSRPRLKSRQGRQFEADGGGVRKNGRMFWANVSSMRSGMERHAGRLAKITREHHERREAQLKRKKRRRSSAISAKDGGAGSADGGIAHDLNNLLI